MPRVLLTFMPALALALMVTTSADAHSVKHRALEIVHPWTPSSPAPAGSAPIEAAVSLKIRNLGKTADRLIAVSSPRAQAVLAQAGGLALQPASIGIEGGAEISLAADGAHIRLTGLAKPLHAYETLPLTLVFAKAGRIEVEVLVEDASEVSPHARH